MYLIAEGELPVCLCAHMDTVFLRPPTTFYFDQEQNVLWSPGGMGADDRAGIAAIIELIERGYRPHIILTDLEERGGIGASNLIEKYPECPFSDCRAFIQLDRQGEKDAVYYECDNPDFEKLITSFGFETEWGTFTDISVFCPQWGIAGVNLSVGYYNEHSQIEILNITQLYSTIDKVEVMLKECGNWCTYSYVPLVYTRLPFDSDSMCGKCICCGNIHEEDKLLAYSVSGKAKDAFLVCENCFKDYFEDTFEEGPQED